MSNPQSALIIGLGAGIMGTKLAGAGIDVVAAEIDPEVVRLALEYFSFQGNAVTVDGRRYLQREQRKSDLIFVDAYVEAIARVQPFPVDNGVILSDDAAPLEALVRRTAEQLREQMRAYVPVSFFTTKEPAGPGRS